MQIGPRIRIGGSLGKLGNKAKKFVGKAARNPFVQGGLGLLTGGATLPFLVGATGGLLKEHAGVGDVLKGGAQGFAAGSAGKGIRSLGSSLLSRGGSSAANSAAQALTPEELIAKNPLPQISSTPSSALSTIGNTATTASQAPQSFLGRVGSTGGRVLSFAEKHPNAAAGVLQGVGNMIGSGAENRLNEAQAEILEQRADESAYDFEQRKRREAELAPLWSALGTTVGKRPIAANPYLPRAS